MYSLGSGGMLAKQNIIYFPEGFTDKGKYESASLFEQIEYLKSD